MVRDVKPGGTFLVNCQWSDEEFAEHMPAVAKRYIANNNVNVYLIDAIDLAAKVGMGKRTNTVLQSAFFALAKVLPAEDALQYMKDAATKSYMKKGQAIVDANHKAIDAGAPDVANELYEYFLTLVHEDVEHVAHGIFGADMKVDLVNDGPFTIVLDTDNL